MHTLIYSVTTAHQRHIRMQRETFQHHGFSPREIQTQATSDTSLRQKRPKRRLRCQQTYTKSIQRTNRPGNPVENKHRKSQKIQGDAGNALVKKMIFNCQRASRMHLTMAG